MPTPYRALPVPRASIEEPALPAAKLFCVLEAPRVMRARLAKEARFEDARELSVGEKITALLEVPCLWPFAQRDDGAISIQRLHSCSGVVQAGSEAFHSA